jgi:hypothetical protein
MGKKAIDVGLEDFFLQGKKLGIPGTSDTDRALDKLGYAIKNGVQKPATKVVVLSTIGIASTITTMRCVSKGDTSKTISVDANPEKAKYSSLEDVLTKPSYRENDSPNFNKGRSGKQVSLIVLHTTESSASSAESWLCNPQKDKAPKERQRVSAHYLLNKEGQLVQLVKEENTAWHCRRYNERAIGIEMEGTYKERITEKQKSTLVQLLSHLLNKYNISINAIKAHSELDPGRKLDPGKENMELVLSSLNEYVANLPVAVTDKGKLLGHPIENTVASANWNQLAERELKQDIVYQARVHEFKSEDRNAWNVSRKYGMNWDDFVAANPIPAKTKFTKLHDGDKLAIPGFKLRAGEIDIRYISNKLEASITVEEIQQQMNKFKSKMNAKQLYETAVNYGIDPRFVMAICRFDSAFATKGEGLRYNNPGNIKLNGAPAKFSDTEKGVEALCRKLQEGYLSKGRFTVESIMPIYAPKYDGADTFAYMAFIRDQYVKAAPNTLVASLR